MNDYAYTARVLLEQAAADDAGMIGKAQVNATLAVAYALETANLIAERDGFEELQDSTSDVNQALIYKMNEQIAKRLPKRGKDGDEDA